jgi:hypothetical protein
MTLLSLDKAILEEVAKGELVSPERRQRGSLHIEKGLAIHPHDIEKQSSKDA